MSRERVIPRGSSAAREPERLPASGVHSLRRFPASYLLTPKRAIGIGGLAFKKGSCRHIGIRRRAAPRLPYSSRGASYRHTRGSSAGWLAGGLADGTCTGSKGDSPRYLFWGVTIGVILLVELAGAIGGWLEKHIGVHIPWTTISGMVGHLEDLWPTTAVIVVAMLAPAAFYALAPVDPPNELGPLRRSSSGRWYAKRDEDREPGSLRWTWGYPPWLVFAICFVVGVVAVLLLDDDFHRAYAIYGTLFVFGIVVPSLLVLARRKVGFPSLFVTVAHLRERHDLGLSLQPSR